VRHAEKDRSDPRAPDPALTAEGRQRAVDLERAIRARHVNAVITTHLKRAVDTGQPTADSLHITPEVYRAAGNGNQVAAGMAELVRRRAGQTILLVGHSNTVPATIAALGGPRLTDLCDTSFSNLFVLVIPAGGAPTLTREHYGAADPPDGPECADGFVKP
jgi:broad specificity phosphatase PhoE